MTRTLPALLESRARGRRTAFIDAATGETLSYARAAAAARRAAAHFSGLGVKEGEVVGLSLPSQAAGYWAILGLLRLGAVPLPLDPRLSPDEVATLLEDAGASRLERGEADLLAVLRHGPELRSRPRPRPEDTALVWATSGTTGLPKGVAIPHRAAFARWTSTAKALGLGEDTVALCLLPLAFSFLYPCLNTFYQGGTLVLAPAYDLALLARLGELVERHKVTTFFAVPAVIRHLVQLRERLEPRRFKSLRSVVCASAVLEPALARDFEAAYGAPLLDCYGLKETGFIALSPLKERDPGSVGRVAPLVQVRVEGPDGKAAPKGKSGEILCRGPLLASGYLKGGKLDRSAFKGGWFRTKDLGRLEKDGRLYLEGRVDELIVRDGLKVGPEEVEGALLRHPAVADAVALGLPDAERGARVAAAVVRKPGARATEGELIAHCRALLAAYKCPERVAFVASVPRTATGKAKRAELRRRFA